MEIEKTTATIKEFIQSKGIDLMSFEIEEIASVITRFDRDIQLKILKKADLTSKDYIYRIDQLSCNNGYTELELFHIGLEIAGNMFRDCNTDDCDIVFADARACIAFKLIFENFSRFFDAKETDKELYLSEKFARIYSGVNIENHVNILENYTIQQGEQLSDKRFVIFVGNSEECEKICNNTYGADNWQRIKYEFKKKSPRNQTKKVNTVNNTEIMDQDFNTAIKQIKQE